jgi:UDP-glucose 4-epimerase
MQRNVLLTGGTGYIGSHTAVELIQSGFNVIIVDDLSNSSSEMVDRIEEISGTRPDFIQLDLTDYLSTKKIFQEHKFQSIIHFAAKKAVGESVEKPLLYYRVNIDSLLNLLELMKIHEVPNLIFSSSCTVYGQPDVLPVTESTPFKPAESPYGQTKQMGEHILRDVCKANPGLNAISLRYFNPVGAHPSAKIGELPSGIPNNLVPYITQTASGKREHLKVFGKDYNTSDGTPIRDYIHVVDLAKAHVVALQRLLDQKQNINYEFFNLGTGKGSTVLEVIRAFESANHHQLNYKIVDRRPGDVEMVYADTTLANSELGWKADLDLEEMMRSAWNWEKQLAQNPVS